MKKIVKLICFVLAVTMLASVFCGCKRGGLLLATYDGGEVYSKDEDVELWTRYFLGYYGAYIDEGKMTTAELGELAVKTIVSQRLREIELEKRGLEVSDEKVEEMYNFNKEAFDKSYEGGFKQLMKDTGLKKKFWKMYARNAVVEQTIVNDLLAKKNFSDEELRNYYVANLEKYIIAAGYTYTAVFVEVKDLSSESEWAEAKIAAQKYIDRIIGGEDFDKVKEDILSVYNEENGYSQSENWSGEGVITFEEIYDVEDLEKALKDIDEEYSDRDPNAGEDTEGYGKYLQYLAKSMACTQSYAMKHMEVGSVYSDPIISPLGWMILRLDHIEEETIYPSLDELRLFLIEDYSNELISSGKLLGDFSDEMDKKYNVKYEEFYYGN